GSGSPPQSPARSGSRSISRASVRERPPLPPGPYLVAGLARSGVAAALALRATVPGVRVIACDSASPREAAVEHERLERAGVEVHLDNDGTQLLSGSPPPRTLVKSPGEPHDAPVVVRWLNRGIAYVGESEL